jgi:glycerol-3-phosphate O-acyltransferase
MIHLASKQTRRPFYLAVLLPLYRLLRRYAPDRCALPPGIKSDLYGAVWLKKGNWLYNLVFPPFFKKIRFEISSEEDLRDAAENGTVIYVMRRRGQLEFNYFGHVLGQKNFPLISYANDISVKRWMPWPLFKATLINQLESMEKIGGIPDAVSCGYLTYLIEEGKTALISVVPSELEDETVILSGSQKLIYSVIKAQNKCNRPIFFVPLEFIWDRRPAREKRSIIDILFGEKENPGQIRKAALFWRNYRSRAVARAGRPINISLVLAEKEKDSDEAKAKHLGRELVSALKLERRTISGPPVRPKSWFVERVMADDEFQQKLFELAASHNKPADDFRELSSRYLSELAADINYTYIELAEILLRWVFKSLYSGLIYNEDGLNQIKELYAKKPIVFVPNHKSHFDYLILSHILYHNFMTVPHIAAGVNLSFWPLGPIFRHCGAFFIRRSFENNELYKACVETYLKILLEEGYSQEFFIEGGRSRTGKLSPPRFGMTKMLTKAMDSKSINDILFVPVSLTYDLVIEQKEYEKELEGEMKEKERPAQIIRLFKYLKRRKPRHGKIYVNFGKPVSSLEKSRESKDEAVVGAITSDICREINRNIVVTPQALTALTLLSNTERAITFSELKRRHTLFLDYLRFKKIAFSQTISGDGTNALLTALEALISEKLIQKLDETEEHIFTVNEDKRLHLEYFKNGCSHFFASIGTFSILLSKKLGENGSFTIDQFLEDFSMCRGLLKYEFQFSTARPLKDHLQKIADFLITKDVLSAEKEGSLKFKKGAGQIILPFSNIMRNFFESLKIALLSVKRDSFEKMEERDLVRRMLQTGKNMLLLGHVHYREAVSKINFMNSLRLFRDLGILRDFSDQLGTKGRKIYSTINNKEIADGLQVKLERII